MTSFFKELQAEVNDQLLSSIKLWRYTLYSSLLKIKLRNANSKLGLLWEPVSTLVVALVLSLVWIKVLELTDFKGYFVYVYTGMVIWAAIAASVSNLCATLLKNAPKLVTKRLSIYSYIFEDILISLLPFFMSLPFVFLIAATFGSGVPSFEAFFYFTIGTVLLCLGAFGFSISVGTIAFLLGDVRQLITSIMRLGFLVTPVIWRPERLGIHENLLLFNPFCGYLHIIRKSILGESVELAYIIQALGITLFLILFGVFLVTKYSMKIQEKALSS